MSLLINDLREGMGLPPLSGQGAQYDLEPALDQLRCCARNWIWMRCVGC